MNNYNMFLIETLTPMHVGSGETTFGVVDNLIQRNPFSKIPVIHSSGIKGSLRECFEKNSQNTGWLDKGGINYIFGEEANNEEGNNNRESSLPGRMIVFEANLLSLPLRATRKVYYNAISPIVIKDFLNYYVSFFGMPDELEIFKKFIENLDFSGKDFLVFDEITELEIEEFTKYGTLYFDTEGHKNKIEEFFRTVCKLNTSNLVIFDDEIFSKICERKMPVIARNNIGIDGISKNLFYEEVLPRSTRLYFMVGEDSTKNGKDYYETTISKLSGDGEVFQFGANYSIGYGFSKLSLMANGGKR